MAAREAGPGGAGGALETAPGPPTSSPGLGHWVAMAQRGSTGNTALHLAAQAGDATAVRGAITDPALGGLPRQTGSVWSLVTARNRHGDSPLMFACAAGGLGCCAAIIKAALGTPQDAVAQRSQLSVSKEEVLFSTPNEEGITPLICCALAPSMESAACAKMLLGYGGAVSLDMKDRHGCTALHYAARAGCSPLVQLLVEAKASPCLLNKTGRTPLDEALCGRSATEEGGPTGDSKPNNREHQAAVTILKAAVADMQKRAEVLQEELLLSEKGCTRDTKARKPGRKQRTSVDPQAGKSGGERGDGLAQKSSAGEALDLFTPSSPQKLRQNPSTAEKMQAQQTYWTETTDDAEWTRVGRRGRANHMCGGADEEPSAPSEQRLNDGRGVNQTADSVDQALADDSVSEWETLQKIFARGHNEVQCLGIELPDVIHILSSGSAPPQLSGSQLDAVEQILRAGLERIAEIRLNNATQLGREALVEELRAKGGIWG